MCPVLFRVRLQFDVASQQFLVRFLLYARSCNAGASFMVQVPSAEVEENVYKASAYVAKHTMTVLEELFAEARLVYLHPFPAP